MSFHFVGVGGSGMSGLAEILLNSGFQVSGSDLRTSEVTQRLEQAGARIEIGHEASNLGDGCSLLVVSSAISPENPEVAEAKRRDIPIVRRAEVLAELMRLKFGVAVAGAHGKTTTTSLCGWLLDQAELDPTVVIGGVVKSIGSGGKLGAGDYLVAESDESDRSFLLLKPSVAVVTNIDSEHLVAYRDFEDLKDSFRSFLDSVPFYGVAICCVDDPYVAEMLGALKRRWLSYGLSAEAQLRAYNIEQSAEGSSFDVSLKGEFLLRFFLPLHGTHMVQNALAAIAVGLEFGIHPEKLCSALSSFAGVKRRMELLFAGSDTNAPLYSDYAHHPTEIEASLAALRQIQSSRKGKLKIIFQPHRYSRLRDCFEQFKRCFQLADELFVSDVYSAGEEADSFFNAENLSQQIEGTKATFRPSVEHALAECMEASCSEDLLCCLGAGSIGRVAEEFSASLEPASKVSNG